MIRYRHLYESEGSDIKLYDVVNCAGYEWYVIDIEDDVVTLLAKNADFGKCAFDRESNKYRTSEIREYLDIRVLPKVSSANPIPTRLSDIEVTDKVWLLSIDEAEDLPKNIRKVDDWWWLRSPGSRSRDAAYVSKGGSIDAYGYFVYGGSGCVRPAMRVRIDELS